MTFCHLLRSTGLCFCLFPCFLFQYFYTYSNKKECSFLQSLGSASFPQDIEENSEARVWIDTIEGEFDCSCFFFFGGGVHCIYSAEVGAGRQFILRRLSV